MSESTPECDYAYFLRDYAITEDGSFQELGLLDEFAYSGEPKAWPNGWAWIGPLTLGFRLINLPIGFHRPQLAIKGELLPFWEFMPWVQIKPEHDGEFMCFADTVFPAKVTDLPFTTTYEVRFEGKVLATVDLRVIAS